MLVLFIVYLVNRVASALVLGDHGMLEKWILTASNFKQMFDLLTCQGQKRFKKLNSRKAYVEEKGFLAYTRIQVLH